MDKMSSNGMSWKELGSKEYEWQKKKKNSRLEWNKGLDGPKA